jgi:hypothetical protein
MKICPIGFHEDFHGRILAYKDASSRSVSRKLARGILDGVGA